MAKHISDISYLGSCPRMGCLQVCKFISFFLGTCHRTEHKGCDQSLGKKAQESIPGIRWWIGWKLQGHKQFGPMVGCKRPRIIAEYAYGQEERENIGRVTRNFQKRHGNRKFTSDACAWKRQAVLLLQVWKVIKSEVWTEEMIWIFTSLRALES